jgi:hypothetical protein
MYSITRELMESLHAILTYHRVMLHNIILLLLFLILLRVHLKLRFRRQ